MSQTTQDADGNVSYFVLGETLKPLVTNAMGSAIEMFDTKGPAGAGPPPHFHPWEEIYFVLSGELDVTVAGETTRLKPGGFAHVPSNTPHGYLNVTEAHFLTIVTRGNAAKFFEQAAGEIERNPTDIAGVMRVAAENGATFLT